MCFLGVVDKRLNLLLGPPMEQFFRVGECPGTGLHVQDWDIEFVHIFPFLIAWGHNVNLRVVEGPALMQLGHGVFCGVAESAAGTGEERDAGLE